MITWVESIGDTIVVGDMVGRKPTAGTISDLIRADGLSTVLGGIMNSSPYTAFSENVALVSITGVKSRWVVALAGCFLVVIGLSPFLATTVAALPKPVVSERAAPYHLTPRELDVLRQLVDGKTDKEIGDELFISHRTVMRHVTGILEKLEAPSRTAAAALAIRESLI